MNNIKTHYVMSEHIYNENFKHINFPIMFFSVKYEDIIKYIPDLKLNNKYSSLIIYT